MALKSGFFDSIGSDRRYSADDLSNIYAKFISNGVYATPATSLQVATAGDMKLKVSPGWAFINSKWLKNDDDYIITLEDSDVEYDRIDRIVVRLDPSDDVRSMSIEVKKGTAASPTPIVPLTRDENGIWEISLAKVWVYANSTEILQSNIVDERANNEACGWVTGLIDQIDTTNLFAQYDTAFNEFMATLKRDFSRNMKVFGDKLRTTLTSFVPQVFGGTCTTVDEWDSFPGNINGYGISKDRYSPQNGDVLLFWVDGVLWTEGVEYSLDEDEDYYRLNCEDNKTGVSLYIQIWNIPKTSSTNITGQTLTISDGTVDEGISGIAEQITDEEEE